MKKHDIKKYLKKPTKRQIMRFSLNALIIVLGNAIAAGASAFFIIPNNFVMTGLGILVRNLLPAGFEWREWAVSLTVYVANILLFLIGVLMLGKTFAAGTLAGTLLYPTFIGLFTGLNDLYVEAHGAPIGMGEEFGSPMLAATIGALLFGLGISIVVRVGASTGGTDIPPLIFQRYFGWPVSVSLWIIDGFIILLQFIAPIDIDAVLYGVIITLIASIVIDKVSPIGMRRTQVKIVSEKYREIRDMILSKISRGVTVLYGQTGYLKRDCHMVLTIISHRQLVLLKAEVQKIDPHAFMTISVVSEVRGKGFASDGVDFLMPPEITDEPDVVPDPAEEENHG